MAFPESVGIDVSKAGGGGSSPAALEAQSKAQTGIEDFSDIISLGPIVFNGFNNLLDIFLGPLSDLEIPVSTEVKTFDGPITFAPGLVAQVKIDFSDFDQDGDGVAEGCTGCTCPTGCAPEFSACPAEAPLSRLRPVCYRIWLRDVGETDFKPFMAGRFDRYATREDPETEEIEENAGAGRFRLAVEARPEPDGTRNPLAFGILYDHLDDADALKKDSEFFVQDRTFDAGGNLLTFINAHASVGQEDPTGLVNPEALKKTVKLDFRETPDPADDPGLIQYIGRFRDDLDFWGGTFNLQDVEGEDPKTVSGENVCARISTGAESARENCIDAGVDVAGEEFLRSGEDADSAFPPDFPDIPTF